MHCTQGLGLARRKFSTETFTIFRAWVCYYFVKKRCGRLVVVTEQKSSKSHNRNSCAATARAETGAVNGTEIGVKFCIPKQRAQVPSSLH